MKSHFTRRKPDLQAPKVSRRIWARWVKGRKSELPCIKWNLKDTHNKWNHYFESYTRIQEHVHDWPQQLSSILVYRQNYVVHFDILFSWTTHPFLLITMWWSSQGLKCTWIQYLCEILLIWTVLSNSITLGWSPGSRGVLELLNK